MLLRKYFFPSLLNLVKTIGRRVLKIVTPKKNGYILVASQVHDYRELLMGGIANMSRGDYRVVLAVVPFVDAVTTMLDASIPLTTREYTEWGNPNVKSDYERMLSWSPYDNVGRHAYPAMYVYTGLWDSQVQYYEPTKWVAKLRADKTGDNPLVLRVNMEGGHGGPAGRFQQAKSRAEYLAFALWELGYSPGRSLLE